MIQRHVSSLLVAYVHEELTDAEKTRVCEHLRQCEQCREELRELSSVHRALRFMPEAAISIDDVRPSPRPWRYVWAASTVSILALGFWAFHTPNRPLTVAKLEGAPLLEGKPVQEPGRIEPGQCILTDARSVAQIDLSGRGHVNVKPNSEVRLVGTTEHEHRFRLNKGMLEAFVSAPPKMFVVETPTATAIDMGCAYTLTAESGGSTRLHVRLGFVCLESKAVEAIVPEGASCRSELRTGLGTPLFDDAPPDFRDAVKRLDHNAYDELALSQALSSARKEDALSLWHLLPRVPDATRPIYAKALSRIAPLPPGATLKGIADLNPTMLRKWRDSILPSARDVN